MKLVEKQPINYKIRTFNNIKPGSTFLYMNDDGVIDKQVWLKMYQSDCRGLNFNAILIEDAIAGLFGPDYKVILLQDIELHYRLER